MASKSRCFSKHYHDSKSEADYCNTLLADVQSGKIAGFKTQHAIPLRVKGKIWKYWKVDFRVTENDGSYSYHESKGWNRSDDNFKLKLSMAMREYPHYIFYVNHQPCTETPMGHLRCRGIISRKKKKDKALYYRTWEKGKGWVTKRVDNKKR